MNSSRVMHAMEIVTRNESDPDFDHADKKVASTSIKLQRLLSLAVRGSLNGRFLRSRREENMNGAETSTSFHLFTYNTSI